MRPLAKYSVNRQRERFLYSLHHISYIAFSTFQRLNPNISCHSTFDFCHLKKDESEDNRGLCRCQQVVFLGERTKHKAKVAHQSKNLFSRCSLLISKMCVKLCYEFVSVYAVNFTSCSIVSPLDAGSQRRAYPSQGKKGAVVPSKSRISPITVCLLTCAIFINPFNL